jgi:hypothetical protein
MTAERTFRLLAGLGLAAVVGPLLSQVRQTVLPDGATARCRVVEVGVRQRLLHFGAMCGRRQPDQSSAAAPVVS